LGAEEGGGVQVYLFSFGLQCEWKFETSTTRLQKRKERKKGHISPHLSGLARRKGNNDIVFLLRSHRRQVRVRALFLTRELGIVPGEGHRIVFVCVVVPGDITTGRQYALIRGIAPVGGAIGGIPSWLAAQICGSTELGARTGILPTIIPALLENIALHSIPASEQTLFCLFCLPGTVRINTAVPD
jgi:hypothetical protein